MHTNSKPTGKIQRLTLLCGKTQAPRTRRSRLISASRFWMVMGISGLYIGWIYGAGAGGQQIALRRESKFGPGCTCECLQLVAWVGLAATVPTSLAASVAMSLRGTASTCDSRTVEDFPCESRTSCMAPRLFGRCCHVRKRG